MHVEVGLVVPVLIHKGGDVDAGDDDVDTDELLVDLRDSGSGIRGHILFVACSLHLVSLQARPALSAHRSCIILSIHLRIIY